MTGCSLHDDHGSVMRCGWGNGVMKIHFVSCVVNQRTGDIKLLSSGFAHRWNEIDEYILFQVDGLQEMYDV